MLTTCSPEDESVYDITFVMSIESNAQKDQIRAPKRCHEQRSKRGSNLRGNLTLIYSPLEKSDMESKDPALLEIATPKTKNKGAWV